MDLDDSLSLIVILIAAIVALFEVLPTKARVFVSSFVLALVSGAIIGFLYVSARQDDYENALNQAKVLVPILIIGITLVAFFIMWRFQAQLEKQYIEKQFVTVRSLMRGHFYAQALDVLAKINNPEARQLETELHGRMLNNPDFVKQHQ